MLPWLALLGCAGGPPPSCIGGSSVACTCSDGRAGAQRCNARGTFDVCQCTSADAGPDGGGAGDGGGTAPDAGGRNVLFSDDFARPSAVKWIPASTVDPNYGNPAPSFGVDGGRTITLEATGGPWNLASGITVAADIGFPGGFTPSGSQFAAQVAELSLIQNSSPGTFVRMTVFLGGPTSGRVDSAYGAQLGGATYFAPNNFVEDGAMHTFSFAIARDGTVRFYRDGVMQGMTSGAPPVLTRLYVSALGASFDNVVVTSP